jgi:hypothetical protein
MFNKQHDGPLPRGGGGLLGRGTNTTAIKKMIVVRNNSVDEGIMTFGLWLNAEDKRSLALPITMREFMEDRKAVLRDNILQKDIIVDIVEGIPYCNQCRSNDCAHVGFAICAEQMKEA